MFIEELRENVTKIRREKEPKDTSYEKYIEIRNKLYEVSKLGVDWYIYRTDEWLLTTPKKVNDVLSWFKLDGFDNKTIHVEAVEYESGRISVKEVLFDWSKGIY